MKDFKKFISNNKNKIFLSLIALFVFLFPKFRSLFKKKDGKVVVNKDGTKPIDTDYEQVSDIEKQAILIADAIYSILHIPDNPIFKTNQYDYNKPEFVPPDYQSVISLMISNKSIIGDIQEQFYLKYDKDFLVCFPYFNNVNSINILISAFKDVSNFTVKTAPDHKTFNQGFGWIPKPHVYDISKYKTLDQYYYDYYYQFKNVNVQPVYLAY